MFDLINGLPVHPLVVHAAVVLGPLAAITLLVYVLVPAWRYGMRWPLVGLALVAGASAFTAKESGERLERRVGDVGIHGEWGDRAFLATALMTLVTLVVVFVLTRARPATALVERTDEGIVATGDVRQSKEGGLRRILALVLSGIAAAAVLFTIYQAGDSGASKVWKDQVSTTQPSRGNG